MAEAARRAGEPGVEAEAVPDREGGSAPGEERRGQSRAGGAARIARTPGTRLGRRGRLASGPALSRYPRPALRSASLAGRAGVHLPYSLWPARPAGSRTLPGSTPQTAVGALEPAGPAQAALNSCADGAAEACSSLQTGRCSRPARCPRPAVKLLPGRTGLRGGAAVGAEPGLRRLRRRPSPGPRGLGRGREGQTEIRDSRGSLGKGFPYGGRGTERGLRTVVNGSSGCALERSPSESAGSAGPGRCAPSA
ncbi:putative uncharacterized protein C20orf204 [Neophocaena asiaeorientalis asiaeorientalis]|uniref:Uncharacterized protein n=1 Tax=Neophocaena asiaeorientalis asiaeorientalis TaxID=1706337 RepID=A0A341CVW0_NEOAA|nr:putative uncharacterized protein C20orf204 [Neophocaena asiaeorientalis asiaeorientalis]